MLSNRKIKTFQTHTPVFIQGYGNMKLTVIISELPGGAATYTPEGVLASVSPAGRTVHFIVPLGNLASVIFDGPSEWQSASSPKALNASTNEPTAA